MKLICRIDNSFFMIVRIYKIKILVAATYLIVITKTHLAIGNSLLVTVREMLFVRLAINNGYSLEIKYVLINLETTEILQKFVYFCRI